MRDGKKDKMKKKKRTHQPVIQLKTVSQVWPKVAHTVSVIKNNADYERAVATLDILLDDVGNDETHPLASLVEVLGVLIEEYENEHEKQPRILGAQALRFLMEEHNLKQSDLPELGSQGVVSEILRGRRKLNLRQIKSLSSKFGVSPAVFIDQ